MTTVASSATRVFEQKSRHVFASGRGGSRYIMAMIALVIAAQAWLVFQKAINWDEFLHFGQIYQLSEGRLSGNLQSLHTRLFGWARWCSQDVVTQIQAARLAMLGCVLLTTACVVMLARRLVDRETALLGGLAYLTAGFVFTNAFTYRPDPVAAAGLMGALCLLARGSFQWWRIVLAGMLIGLAGALTIKSIFYAPCFAAIACLQWFHPGGQRRGVIFRSIAIVVVAILFFALLVGLHGANLPAGQSQERSLSESLGSFLRFFEFEQVRFVFAEMALAPLVTLGLILLVPVARKMPADAKILILGLCGPLLCILFYRNTFPYFFTFLLPPICVAIAPSLVWLTGRYGLFPVIALGLSGPVFLLVQEPYGTLERQRATINEIERLFPEPTPYLSYSSYVPHYPRQFPSLISGVALNRYWNERPGQIARDIEAGRIAFVVATGDALDLVFKGEGSKQILPRSDVAALRENFLPYSDTIHIAGRRLCRRTGAQKMHIVRSGPYTVDGGDLMVDGERVADGDTLKLSRGHYEVRYEQPACVRLWALDHVPRLPADFPAGPIAGGF